jgi:hypothetical protein
MFQMASFTSASNALSIRGGDFMALQFGDTAGPRNLYEAGVMLVALAGALDEAMVELAAIDPTSTGDWLMRLRRNAVLAAKTASSPSGTPEATEAQAVRKALHLLETMFDNASRPAPSVEGLEARLTF